MSVDVSERLLWRRNDLLTEHVVRYADALIEIASCFCPHPAGHVECWNCGEDVERGCDEQCPGLAARRALGVA
jgi:hypothetical protein